MMNVGKQNEPPNWEWFILPIIMIFFGMVYYCFTRIKELVFNF